MIPNVQTQTPEISGCDKAAPKSQKEVPAPTFADSRWNRHLRKDAEPLRPKDEPRTHHRLLKRHLGDNTEPVFVLHAPMLPAMSYPPILECVANFSDGRRREVVQRIVNAAAASDARILDVHSDPDHNRSVLTMAGRQDQVVGAAVAATREAVALIDLNLHQGAHPRLGAMDVIPFVPVLGTRIPEAAKAAMVCAERIWSELAVPCFLYEEASRGRPRDLPSIRRDAFLSLTPDFGGPAPHPTAGATVVGARETLVAYNVNLATNDIEVARRMAAEIRERDGGLPHVRALGLELRGLGMVQVSTNLIAPAVTKVADVFDRITQLAGNEGVEVVGAEIVGLVPRIAVGERNQETLGLSSSPKILEDELGRAFRPEA